MNETVILIGIGLILGALLASGVWLVLFVINKAERQLAREKNLIIKSIADESAEADKVLSSEVSKAMNAHALRSALLPKIDKMHKMITANMHILDIYFIKYMESRIATYKASFEGGEPAAAFTADRFPGDIRAVQADAAPEKIVQDIRGRMESSAPPQPARAPAMPPMPPGEETIRMAPQAPLKQKPVPAAAAPHRAPAPPAYDPRTGYITVEPEVKEEKPVRPQQFEKAAPRPAAVQPPVVEKKPAPGPQRIPQPVRPPRPEEEAFDLEKAVAAKAERKTVEQPGAQLDTRAMSVDRTEKTLQWDRSQLMGAAAPPEAIVVEGAEVARKAEPAERKARPAAGQAAPAAPTAANKAEEPAISGEDIENTMDSFFGLGDK